MRKIFFCLCFCTIAQVLWAQDTTHLKVFTPDMFIQMIKATNPIAKIADIQVSKANADLQTARGAFDPSISYAAASKTLNGKNYYNYNNPELKLPTPIGVDIKAGLENNSGDYLTSEATKGQSSYLGLEVSLLKGLLTDSRRTALRDAKIMRAQSEQDRLQIVNDLLYEAYADYWQWAGACKMQQVYSEYLDIARSRLRLIRILYQQGNYALADTVEAYTQVQSYELQQAEAQLKVVNASLILSNYLWIDDLKPFQVPENYTPDLTLFEALQPSQNLDAVLQQSAQQNPNLLLYDFKLQRLEVERKLKLQSLLPSLKLKANLLSKNYFKFPNTASPYLDNNYKWGIDFTMPLFFREGRGAYRKTKLKIEETKLQFENKQRETESKIKYYFNSVQTLQLQLNINKSAYQNYLFMLKNENLKLSNGESSLFLINSRESKVLSALQKQIDLQIQYNKATYALQWAGGLLK